MDAKGVRRIFDDTASLEAVIDAAGERTFERLYALVKRGYRPDLDETYTGAIWLRHPSKRCAVLSSYCIRAGLLFAQVLTQMIFALIEWMKARTI